jgi:peptidoglycan/xylan/chitin deacetylase (PgdA/CDA1 family)
MKKLIKRIAVNLMYYSGLPFLLREWKQRDTVTIIVLHDPKPGQAGRIFDTLSRYYNIISLDQYLVYRESAGKLNLPPRSLVITLDDGHVGNFELLPLLKEKRLPVTVFLCAGIINTHRHFWFRYGAMEGSSEDYKRLENSERLRRLSLRGFTPQTEFEEPQALNANQISAMSGFVNFQSHTVFHPCLPQCNDMVAEQELRESKEILEKEFKLGINAIAYPNGDYTERDIGYAKSAGYSCGLTVDAGYNNATTDLFRLKRFSMGDADGDKLVIIKASGLWAYMQRLIGIGN